jgi:hypothetical protein
MSDSKTSVIRYADEALRDSAVAFIAEEYAREFGTRPQNAPDHLFVATCGDEIVGTLGLNMSYSSLPRLARVYRFDWDKAPYPVELGKIVEMGRWIAKRPGVADALLCAGVALAFAYGKSVGWCEQGTTLNRVCRAKGLALARVDAELDLAQIDPSDMSFYKRTEGIGLYMFELRQWQEALDKSRRNWSRHVTFQLPQ